MSQPNLSADDQRNLRDAASYAWRQSGGKYLRSAAIFRSDSRVVKFDPMTVIFLLQIAFKLWQYWRKNNVSEPSVVSSEGEPIFGGAH
jgi:hypothetical protein